MIWLAWRQFRTQAAVVFGALAALAVVVIVTGLQLRHWYHSSGIRGCAAVGDCNAVTAAFTTHYGWLQTLLGSILILFLPAVIGVFWGAPLIARELDTGTYRLAWTQSVTRARWLTAKVAVVGLASVVASGLLSWMVTWWFVPLDKISDNKFDVAIFSERDIVPIAYAAFGFALGLTVGLLLRRTLPAMATTLAGYIAARAAVLLWVRPHFATPLRATGLLQPPPGAPGSPAVRVSGFTAIPRGAWLISSQITDASGHRIRDIRITPNDPCVATRSCLAGFHQTITYQPVSRYWPFQWDETALFFGMAAILIGFCFWWITGHRPPKAVHTGPGGRTDTPNLPQAPTAVRQYVP